MSKTIDQIIEDYKVRSIHITVQEEDLRVLYHIQSLCADIDTTGIISHILGELGVDIYPDDGV